MKISEKFGQYISKYSMLSDGDKVLCAVSGGADSVCLLELMLERGKNPVACAHFNHRLRGEESDRDENYVRSLCESLGVEFISDSGDVLAYAAQHGMGTEEAAREMRYAFLYDAAKKCGAARIATAHNAEDNAETVIMNLARGAGLNGLCGIPPVRGGIIRPLLGVSRSEICAFLDEKGIAHVEDSTNSSDDCARNRIRHNVLPVLREQNGAAVENIGRACENLRKDEAFLLSLARSFFDENFRDASLPVSSLRNLPDSVRMRVLKIACGNVAAKHIEAVDGICRESISHAYTDIPGMRVQRDFDRLIFGAEERSPIPDTPVLCPGEIFIPDCNLKIICEQADFRPEINKSFNILYFKNGSISGTIFVTSRKPGDSIELAGRGCTKTLKKLFTEAKIPLNERASVPVFRDEAGIIAVGGFGVSRRCAASVTDTEIIKITVLNQGGRDKNGKRHH